MRCMPMNPLDMLVTCWLGFISLALVNRKIVVSVNLNGLVLIISLEARLWLIVPFSRIILIYRESIWHLPAVFSIFELWFSM